MCVLEGFSCGVMTVMRAVLHHPERFEGFRGDCVYPRRPPLAPMQTSLAVRNVRFLLLDDFFGHSKYRRRHIQLQSLRGCTFRTSSYAAGRSTDRLAG
jgi:hypothetical protein